MVDRAHSKDLTMVRGIPVTDRPVRSTNSWNIVVCWLYSAIS